MSGRLISNDVLDGLGPDRGTGLPLSPAPAGACQGYYTTSGGSGLTATAPQRILDTRNGTGGFTKPVGAAKPIALQVTGRGGGPAAGVTAVALNLTAAGPTASGWIVAYPDGKARPLASNLNFTKGETTPTWSSSPSAPTAKSTSATTPAPST